MSCEDVIAARIVRTRPDLAEPVIAIRSHPDRYLRMTALTLLEGDVRQARISARA